VDRNPQRLALAKKIGANLIVDADVEEPVDSIKQWTGGYGVEFSIEAVGKTVCRERAISCTAFGRTVACIGLDEETCFADTRPLAIREIDIRAAYAYTRKDFADALQMLADRRLDWEPLVTTAGLDAGQKILEYLAGSEIMKAVFLI
jgi:threonine dehydrogenase-like Zn-dependent dehydrogenase